MIDRTISAADLHRLTRERDEADRQYNDALTALDLAIQALPEIPRPPPPIDTFEIGTLQRLSDETANPPGPAAAGADGPGASFGRFWGRRSRVKNRSTGR